MNTIYHSPYNDNKVTEESPAILTYYFDEGADMDYLVYYPRTDGGANGRFKEVEIRVRSNANTYGTDEWTTVIKKNLGGSSSAARIDFPVSQIGVSAVQIVVNSGIGDFASCAEMEFIKRIPILLTIQYCLLTLVVVNSSRVSLKKIFKTAITHFSRT